MTKRKKKKENSANTMFLIFGYQNKSITNKSVTNLATLINFESPLIKQAVGINMLVVFVFFHAEAHKTE